MPEKREFFSIPEAAIVMGLSRIAVFKKVKKGQLPAIRIGRNWAVPADALENTMSPFPPSPPSVLRETTASKHPKTRSNAVPPVEMAPQRDSMDDIGWD